MASMTASPLSVTPIQDVLPAHMIFAFFKYSGRQHWSRVLPISIGGHKCTVRVHSSQTGNWHHGYPSELFTIFDRLAGQCGSRVLCSVWYVTRPSTPRNSLIVFVFPFRRHLLYDCPFSADANRAQKPTDPILHSQRFKSFPVH